MGEEEAQVEPWQIRLAEDSRDVELYSVVPFDLRGNSTLPTNGTVFTARFPKALRGGLGTDLKIDPVEKIFSGYSAHSNLQSGTVFFYDSSVLRSSRPGDFGRFVVWDDFLNTAHSVSERNWFRAALLRPVVRGEDIGQILVDSNDFGIMLASALTERTASASEQPGRVRMFHQVIDADYEHLMNMPLDRLETAYKTLRGYPSEE